MTLNNQILNASFEYMAIDSLESKDVLFRFLEYNMLFRIVTL